MRASRGVSVVKNLAANAGFDPWVGKIPEEGNGNPLQYSFLKNLMDRGAWWAIFHVVTRVRLDLATKPPQNRSTIQ